jgi:peptidyl-prolyl cis-trans isomerase SurA
MRASSVILGTAALIGSVISLRAELVSGIQAIVHDSIITHEEVESMAAPAAEVLWRQYRNQPEVFQKKLTDARAESLEQLLERQLILRDFKSTFNQQEAAIEKEIEKEVNKEIQEEIRANYAGNRMSMLQTLQARGITMEKHRQQIHDRMIIGWLRQKNISSEIVVSPHKVEAYYQEHRDEFKMQDEVKLRMIVLKNPVSDESARTEKLAEEILTKLKEGATFAEMATIHSEGSQRNQGGDWGWWEQSRLNKGLADMANSLQPGQRSGVTSRSAGDDYWVCQYENGQPTVGRRYVVDPVLKKEKLAEERRFESASSLTNLPPPQEFYIMLVEDKRPAHFKSVNEVRDQIEKDLLAQEQGRIEKQWVERLKKKTFVRYF